MAGVTPRRMRARDLEAPFRGVRVKPLGLSAAELPEHPTAFAAQVLTADILRRARAFQRIASSEMFFSHVTAAVIWGLPLPLTALLEDSTSLPAVRAAAERRDVDAIVRRAARLDVAVLSPHRASKSRGVHARRIAPRLTAVRWRSGLRVASPASTWAQLATILSVERLVEVGDALVYIPRRRGLERGVETDALATSAQVRAVVAAGPRAGIARLRDAVDQIRVGSASPPETRIRLGCVAAGLPEPVLDIDVVPGSDHPIGCTELAYPTYRLLIEHEGDHHRTDPEQWDRDIAKYAACEAAGWTVLRLTARDMRNGAARAVERIRDALRRAGWQPDE